MSTTLTLMRTLNATETDGTRWYMAKANVIMGGSDGK